MANEPYQTSPAEFLAIVDTLYRFTLGVDLNDRTILESALTIDAVLDFTHNKPLWGLDFPLLEGREAVITALQATVGPLDTTHVVTNPRVTVEGESATLEALLEAQHLPPSDHSRHCLMKNRYTTKLLLEDGKWKLGHLFVKGVWFTGDPKVLIGQ